MPEPTRPVNPPPTTDDPTDRGPGACAQCTAALATIDTADGTGVCAACAAAYHHCPGCQQWYRKGSRCPDCLGCDRCRTVVPDYDTVQTIRGSTICDWCLRNHYWQCDTCEGWNRDGMLCGNGCCNRDDCDCDECRGDECSGDDNRVGRLLHDYDYKPSPVFHGTGPLFLGPEIEIEVPYARTEECVAIARSYLGELGYLKVDGSVPNGFEIVTHPMSYQWAVTHFPWPMLTELARCGATVTADTGLHVHVSRAGFGSPCHTYRWMKFIYRNQPAVEAFAGRSSPTWAAFTADDRRAVKHYAKGACSARYRAINTGNRDTFELRMFASSLDPAQVRAVLGFAAASVEYTRGLTVPAITRAGGWSWPAFTGWLADRPSYAPLRRQLEALPCVC